MMYDEVHKFVHLALSIFFRSNILGDLKGFKNVFQDENGIYRERIEGGIVETQILFPAKSDYRTAIRIQLIRVLQSLHSR
jgi:hypothetical protein